MLSSKKTLYSILAVCIATLALTDASAKGPRCHNWDSEARLRKADYAYTQAAVAAAIDSVDLASRLAEYASALNPSDLTMRSYAGLFKVSMLDANSPEAEQLYQTVLKAYFEHPDDYANGQLAASFAKSLRHYSDIPRIWECLDSIYPTRQDIGPELADAYMMNFALGDTSSYAKAMAIYNRIERGTGKDVGLSSQKIRAMQLRGDTAGITAELNSLTQALPHESRAWLLGGLTYQALNLDSVKELEYLHQAAKADPTDGRVSMAIADYYLNHGDSARYNVELRHAILSPSLDFESKSNLITNYVRANLLDSTRWDEIQQTFDSLTVINAGESDVHAMYGAFLAAVKRPGAIEQYSYALSLNPGNDNQRSTLIYLYANEDDTISSVKIAREGMELSPDNLFYPLIVMQSLARSGKFSEAYALIDSVDVSEVNNPQAVASFLTSAADIYQLGDSIDRALSYYDRAIELAPDQPMAYNNAAYAMAVNDRDLDKAQRYARYAVLAEVDNPTYLDTYAWVYFKQKNYPEAKSYIDKALAAYSLATDIVNPDSVALSDISPDSADIAETVDSLMVEDENLTDSISAEVLEHAGDIYFMNGLPDQAVKFWERAYALAPENELLGRKVKNKTYFYK